MRSSADLVRRAGSAGTAIPAFNTPYLPIIEPTIRALRETECFGFITVARLEWEKFEAGSPRAVYAEYQRVKDERYSRLHLDHVPVIDEDGQRVDFEALIADALRCGYPSVMVDGSRLPLEENIAATRKIVAMAHARGTPVEAELGAVLGHEEGPLPPYEELFASARGFTDPEEAARFVRETEVDWLSVAIGNVHGAISAATRNGKKVEAKLNIEHLVRIRDATGVPLVLHGGTGISREHLRAAIRNGIAKINIATATRQPYEAARKESAAAAQEAAYQAAIRTIEDLGVAGSAHIINPPE